MLTKTPTGLAELTALFGDYRHPHFERDNIASFLLPYPLYYNGTRVTHARCHALLVDNFQGALAAVKEAGLEREVRNYSGIYAVRAVRGGIHPSTHAWGIAIDLEAEKYPLGSLQRMPGEVVQCFTEVGFLYGGDFLGRKDPMHYQYVKGY